MHTLHLPWPERALWANARPHWRAKAKAVASARTAAWASALAVGLRPGCMVRPLLRFQFHPPTKRLPDLSNMPHTAKAAIDGIADALAMDDRAFLCVWPLTFAAPIKGGRVVVTVEDWGRRCLSCQEPLDGAAGEGCASATAHVVAL